MIGVFVRRVNLTTYLMVVVMPASFVLACDGEPLWLVVNVVMTVAMFMLVDWMAKAVNRQLRRALAVLTLINKEDARLLSAVDESNALCRDLPRAGVAALAGAVGLYMFVDTEFVVELCAAVVLNVTGLLGFLLGGLRASEHALVVDDFIENYVDLGGWWST